MSQSRFSIVLVGVSALLRRPLVSRLRPADGERSPWVVFAARRRLPFRRLPLGGLVLPLGGWPSGSLLPLFGTHRFGVAARWVGLRAHGFRFSARTASGVPLGGLAFGLTASAFRHAPLRSGPRRADSSAFRFGDCRSAGWPSGSRLPLFGMHRFGVAAGRVGSSAFCFGVALGELVLLLGGLAFGLTASAFRHASLRRLSSASWPSGSRLPLFGMRRSAPPCRRREDRRSTPTRHLFHFKTLISTC